MNWTSLKVKIMDAISNNPTYFVFWTAYIALSALGGIAMLYFLYRILEVLEKIAGK